jgi:hypothetical protein
MKLQDLIEAVKEQKLDRQQLEGYRDEMVNIFTKMQFEMADLEKAEALFMNSNSEVSVAERKVRWKATDKGQRLIELKRYATATTKILDSLKNRIYTFI